MSKVLLSGKILVGIQNYKHIVPVEHQTATKILYDLVTSKQGFYNLLTNCDTFKSPGLDSLHLHVY